MHSFRRKCLVFFLFALLLPGRAVAEPDFDALEKSVVRIVTQTSQGSRTGTGFAINDQGYIATNEHVIAGANSIKAIPTNSSKRYDVKVIATSRELDLAIAYIADLTLPPLTLSLAPATKGQKVWSIGYPGGADRNRRLAHDPTVQVGVIGRISWGAWPPHTQELRIIQHSAPLNPGNSGGPLLDDCSRAVGVNTQAPLVVITNRSGGKERVPSGAGIYWSSHIRELATLLGDHDIDFQSEDGDCRGASGAGGSGEAKNLVWLLLLALVALVMALKKPRQLVVQQVSRRIGVRTVAKVPKYGLVLDGKDGCGNPVRIELSPARFAAQRLGLSLGRHPDLVDEVVAGEDETVSRRHLRIAAKGDKFYVEDLNSLNGTFLNGKRLKRCFKPTRLGHGAEVALGDLELVASVKSKSELSQVDAMAQAKCSVYRIGRGPDVDIQINDRSVSRVHAELIVTESGSYYLTDCASKHGSYVVRNGEKTSIRQEVISPTDEILLGHYRTTVRELKQMGEGEAARGSRD